MPLEGLEIDPERLERYIASLPQNRRKSRSEAGVSKDLEEIGASIQLLLTQIEEDKKDAIKSAKRAFTISNIELDRQYVYIQEITESSLKDYEESLRSHFEYWDVYLKERTTTIRCDLSDFHDTIRDLKCSDNPSIETAVYYYEQLTEIKKKIELFIWELERFTDIVASSLELKHHEKQSKMPSEEISKTEHHYQYPQDNFDQDSKKKKEPRNWFFRLFACL